GKRKGLARSQPFFCSVNYSNNYCHQQHMGEETGNTGSKVNIVAGDKCKTVTHSLFCEIILI
ncbi:hypothetical protein, partial [uncultured Oscillibacter sp.]|uniref:hypothetical protein n=1 Tax=uncultured Oscillibacter sp. TaxID=876091 RepID=UPI00272D6306